MSCLTKLEELNLNGNMFSNTYKTIDTIVTIPKLRLLNINLNEEDQVDYIMKVLPDLEFLNGLAVDRDDEEEEEEEETEQDETEQHISTHQASPENVDYSEDLNEPEKSQEDEEQTNSYAPITPPEVEEVKVSEPAKPGLPLDELEKVAMLYDSIRNIHKSRNPERDQELAKDFDEYLKRVMKNLYQTVQYSNAPQSMKTVNILKAKYDLYDICLSKLIELVVSESTEMGQILGEIHGGVHNIVSSFYDVLLIENPGQSSPKLQNMDMNVQKYQSENKKLINMVESMENEINNLRRNNEQMRSRFEQDKTEFRDQIDSLEVENKKILDTLIKHSKGVISNMNNEHHMKESNRAAISDLSNNVPQGFSNINASRAYQKSPPKIPKSKEFTYSKYGAGKNRASTSNGPGKRNYKATTLSGSIGHTQMRSLSLKQLKDLIADIYQQKIKYDQKNEENQIARETMEEYMYTYLNQKYGLKNLIIEWAAAIINGVKKYSKEDHAVSLFGKILRNECDEEFRFIQMHVQQTLSDLLRMLLKERFPNKTEQGISHLHDQIQNGFIEDAFWAQIIEKMYDEQDCYTLEETFRNVIQDRHQSRFSGADKKRPSKRKMTREERLTIALQKDSEKLKYSEFQKAVLDFQLKEHEKFLYKFIVIFKQVDQDNNGILNEDEFVDLVKKMKI